VPPIVASIGGGRSLRGLPLNRALGRVEGVFPMNEEILENPVTGESMRILESSAQTFKAQYSLRPHGEIPGEHLHPHKEQLISVLAGEMHVRINGEHRIVRAGETTTIPVGARHFQWNPCDSEAVVIEEIRPAGRIHDFFKVLFGLARDGRTDVNGHPSLALSAALFSEFKDSIRPASLGLRLLIGVLGPIALALGYRRQVEKYLHERRAA
jgi:quercetin dioxygenase-like cupin family protein